MNFLEKLVSLGIVGESQVPEINRRAKQKFGGDVEETLLSLGIDEDVLLKAKSEFLGIPYKTVNAKAISFDLLKYVPEDSADHYKLVPIGFKDGVLEIGMLNPSDIDAIDALQFISSKTQVPYKIFLISKSNFKSILSNYKGITTEVEEAISDVEEEFGNMSVDELSVEATKAQDKLKPGEEEKIVEEAPIIKIVAVIIRHAIEGNASDIHIENTGDKVKVRFRVDGVLHTSLVLPTNVYAGVVARIKILSKLHLDEKRKPQDGGFSAKIDGRKIDFRVSTLPAVYGEKVELRILDVSQGVKTLAELGLTENNIKIVKEALSRPYGLVLITGPTGSGKTTTLYSMLNQMDREKNNVVSLEDPVEYHIPDVNQSQVMPEIGYTFASGLRSILRQDPNIIMVGEIRDRETAQLAIQASLTGHLVLSTLHTNNAIGVIPRLIDMGVDPYLIAPTLSLAIAQRLTTIICPPSRKAVPIEGGLKEMLDRQFKDLPEKFRRDLDLEKELYEAVPSSECPSGTRGRVAVFEMFSVDKDMENLILHNPVAPEIYKLARSKGMLSMREDAILKSAKGEVSLQEIYTFE